MLKLLFKSLRKLNKLYGAYNTNSQTQVMLKMMYRDMRNLPLISLPSLGEVGFKCFSQFEEDGMLLYIFSLIGEKSKKVVEICAGNGIECMGTNLIINHGWQGFLFDGDKKALKTGRLFFQNHPLTFVYPPVFKKAWITAENINDILRKSLILKESEVAEVDLFSLDVDGMDYWFWKYINAINPRVCIFETNNHIPSDLSLTAKYSPDFHYNWQDPKRSTGGEGYSGASLKAMVALCAEKGYRLIGAHQYGFNCIFMRNDVGNEYFPEVSIESVHDNPYTKYCQTILWASEKTLPWQEI